MLKMRSVVTDFIANVLPDGEYEESEIGELIFSEDEGVEWWSML